MVYRRQIGARVKRKEDPRLITGSSTYVDDLRPARTAHLAVLRSIYAHARIVRVDLSAALAHPGVIAAYSGADFRALCGPLPGREGEAVPGMTGFAPPTVWPVAADRVRYVGEAVAIVVAVDRYVARDALDLIAVEYDPLPAVVDAEAALAPSAPRLYDEAPGNVAFTWRHARGDASAAFAAADVVVEQRMVNQRIAAAPMEPRAILAQPDPLSGGLIVTTSTQNPHGVRKQLAGLTHLPETLIRVIAPEVGGGFGVKSGVYPEDAMVATLALRLRRPIKWTETRGESLGTTQHGRGQVAEVAVAARADGEITALRLHVIANLGGFPRGIFVPILTGRMMNGVYRYENVDLEITGVYTNTMATGAYRGAGRPEAAYYIERIVDLLARELGVSPIAIRRRNFIPPDAFPYATATGLTYDSGDYNKALTRVLEFADYDALRAEQARLRGEGRYLGIGLVTTTEISGGGPFESADVRVEPSGAVTVSTGISPHGQGEETTFAQIVADELGVALADIIVVHGDTARTPPGIGTFGSRGLVVGGSALVRALASVKEKARKIAAHLLEAAPEDIEVRDGRFGVAGTADRAVSLKEIAAAAYGVRLPAEIDSGLEAVEFFRPELSAFPFSADICVVEVDAETGVVTLRDYFAVDDCGRVISPLLVEGQIHGGLAQGIAQALWEEVVYDASGQLVTGSLMDYAVPTARALPRFASTRTETPTRFNPLGAKGIGELATVSAPPAVVNAVLDALAPFGIRHLDMPLHAERIWRTIHDARTGPTPGRGMG
jgi:aerobic carbon-monoxide dehydrogenase large subunit